MLHLAAAAILLAIALFCDLKTMTIPNRLTLPACAAGWGYFAFAEGVSGITKSFIGMLAGLLPMLLLYAFKGVGAGDVKLFAALGAWIGAPFVIQLTVYSILFAGAIGILILITRRQAFRKALLFALSGIGKDPAGKILRAGGLERTTRFPFMLAVGPAAAAVWYLYIYLGG